MFSYLRNFFIDSKHEFLALKNIGFPLFIYQTIIRISLFIIFGIFYGFFVHWIKRNPADDFLFLTGIDTFKYIYVDRLIIVIIFSIFLFLFSLFIETLGVYSLSRQYYLGQKISLRRTFLDTIKYFKVNLKVQTLKYLYIFSNILFVGFFLYVIFIFFPNIFGLILGGILIIQNIIIVIHKIIDYKDVGQKVFENRKNIFDIYGYKMTTDRKKKIFRYYICKIFILLVFVIFLPIIFLMITRGICIISFENQILSSLLLGLNFSVFLLTATVLSYLYISFFSLRATRKYLGYKNQLEKKLHTYIPKNIKFLFIIGSVIFVGFVLIQSIFFYLFYQEKILQSHDATIFAHRASMMMPTNNSLEALNYSIKNKVDFVEIDVQLSKEGVPVIFHDYTYFDGKQKKYIQNTPLKEIKEFDLKTNQNGSGISKESIPTLEEFLKVAKGKIKVNIEIKTTENFETELAEKVATVVQKLDMTHQVMITSFEYKILQKIKKILPNVQTGLIITAYIGELEEIDSMNVDWLMINNIYYTFYQNTFDSFSDKKIALWSFSSSFDGEDILYENIDGVIVDNPVATKKNIDEYNKLSLGEKYYKQLEKFFLVSF